MQELDKVTRDALERVTGADFRGSVQAEMPKYKCHKVVWALKIREIVGHLDGSATITPNETGFAPFGVEPDYVRKHQPSTGGYYVVYEDGYKSFSPAEAFENGYTRI